jgi:pimeloyl-ACP methyl ester carboxylesterase
MALVVASLAACGSNHTTNKQPDAYVVPDAPEPDADTGVVPRVEPAACRFHVDASLGLTEGSSYTCGDLVAEENRAAHTGRVRVHFIRFHATTPSTDATIYLDGGPGGDGQDILDFMAYLGTPFLNTLLVDGDFVTIAQRGTDLSVPYLMCTAQDCSDQSATVDLPSYNTAYNADDVDDLRAALGLTHWNVYGISYGSRLGLEVIRRHGDHLRSALIEGLVPPQVQWTAAVPASFYSALTALNASCQAAGTCGTNYGDLVAKFGTGVDALNTTPVSITVQGSPFMLDGTTYAYLMFEMLYSRSSYDWLPLVINDLAVSRTDRIQSFLASWLAVDSGAGISMGLYYSIVCGELYNPPDPNAQMNATAGVPQRYIDLFGSDYTSLVQQCSTWPKSNMQAQLSQPVTSTVRTLVSSGRLDPITPPPNGALAASTLSDSLVVIHENSGHGATLQSPCGQQNLHNFLTDPTGTLDTSCAAAITTSYMIMTPFAGKPPSPEILRAELSIAPIPPFIRKHLQR